MSSPSTYDWDQAFLDFPQATPAAAGAEDDYRAENPQLQDQGHSDTHSSDPSYSPPPLSPAYLSQQASNFRADEVAQDFHAPFGYQQEWTDGATTGVAPSQVSWAGRPSVPSSSSADPPLVSPSVAPSALSQPLRPQKQPPAPIHSRLDFFLQPASFTPAPQAYTLPHHASSSIAGESQNGAGGCRKRSRSDKENDTEHSPLRPVKRAREQPDHEVPVVIAPQPMLAPSTSHNINLNLAAEWTRSATFGRVCERRQSRSNHLSARHAVHHADNYVRAAASSRLLGNSEQTSVRNVGNSFGTNLTGRFPQLEESPRSASWNVENATYQPQRNGVLNAYPPIMGARVPVQDGDDGYPAQAMYAPYTYPPPVVPLSPPHAAPPIPDARPVRPDIIPQSLSRRASGLRRSQLTLAPRAPAVQNTAPADPPQEVHGGTAREVYPGSNSIQVRQRIAQRAARRTHAIAPYPRRSPAPVPAPENTTVPSSSRIRQQRLPPAPHSSKCARWNPPPAATTPKDSETRRREYPCPMHRIVERNPGLYADGTPPAELCSRGTKPFTRPCDSRRHFESEHLGVRYRMLRGPHRGCGEFSRRDAILRHVRDCRKFPGALRVLGWLGVFVPCWNASGVHRACGVGYRRKLERDLGGSGMLVYKCECCRVLSGEELGGAGDRGAREIEGTTVKIKEEELDTTGLLHLAGSQTNSEAAYESEEDSPCAMATTGGEPKITPAQTSDGDGGSIHVQLGDASTNARDSLFSDEGDDADADGSDSETDAGPAALHPSGIPMEAQSKAREDSRPAIPLRLAAATAVAAADTSSGQSEVTSSVPSEQLVPAQGDSDWEFFDFSAA